MRRAVIGDVRVRRGAPGVTLVLVGHIAVAVAAAWLSHALLRASLAAGLVSLPVAWLVIGSRFRALGNMMHECAHATLVAGRRANRALGHLLGFFDFTDFTDYVRQHRTHHEQVGAEGDLDVSARCALFTTLGPLGGHYLRYALALRHLPHYIRPVVVCRRDSLALGLSRAGFNLSLLALAQFVVGWAGFVVFYLAPYVTAYQVFRFLSDAADHGGISGEPDEFDRARNHIHRWRWVNWLVFPGQDQYHLVHHLFPHVPCSRLPHVHRQLLLASPDYAAREHDLGRLWRARLA